MLKLKKTSLEKDISIILRDKESVFTKPLLQAFILAASFHLLFLLIFHVAPFKINWNETILPPAEVESSIDFKDVNLVIDLSEKNKFISGLPEPKEPLPKLPLAPKASLVRPIDKMKDNGAANNPFFELETEIYTPIFILSKREKAKPVEIIISGTLAEIGSLPSAFDMDEPFKNIARQRSLKSEYRATYNVLVDSLTGKIFWYEQNETSGVVLLDKYSEKLLGALYFPKEESRRLIINGTIELQFNPGSL